MNDTRTPINLLSVVREIEEIVAAAPEGAANERCVYFRDVSATWDYDTRREPVCVAGHYFARHPDIARLVSDDDVSLQSMRECVREEVLDLFDEDAWEFLETLQGHADSFAPEGGLTSPLPRTYTPWATALAETKRLLSIQT